VDYHIPDDTIYSNDLYAMAPRLWHWTAELAERVGKIATGKAIKIAIGDTGYTKHVDGPVPVASKSFISGQSAERDGNGHGCIAPTDEVYTSNCGIQAIETFFKRMSGVVHFLQDGSIIKDISRYNIFTFSLDTSGKTPKPSRNRITHVHKLEHDGDVFEVSVGGEKLTLTPWHPVYVEVSSTGTKKRVGKKRADELVVGDKICRIPKSTQSISEEILQIPTSSKTFVPLDENLAMWVGLLLTDGHLAKRQRTVQFSSANDKHIDLFVSLTEKIFGITPSVYNHRTAKSARCSGDCWVVASAFMPIGAKSRTLDFPELIAKSPRNVIESFFAGCIEGDGCVYGDRIRLTTGSEKFASRACKLLASLGVRCSRSIGRAAKCKFGGNDWWVIRIGSWAELANKLQVKATTQAKPKGNLSSAITKICKKHYKGSLYDFTVEGSHNYVANGLVVSNTHCAGTALGRNGIGVAPEADLIVFKCLSDQGSGSSTGIAQGIRWAADQGADVISLSLGGGGSDSMTNQAIDYAFSLGCIVNAAAGNSGYNGSNTIGWPARYGGCICCGAYQASGQIANFSSGGKEIDWACPGQDIISFSKNGSGYTSMSGTSMATPFGSGLLACIVEVMRRQGKPQWKATDAVRAFFKANLKDAGAPGFDPRFGHGIPVADSLLQSLLRSELLIA
jgi:hypothetical protein